MALKRSNGVFQTTLSWIVPFSFLLFGISDSTRKEASKCGLLFVPVATALPLVDITKDSTHAISEIVEFYG